MKENILFIPASIKSHITPSFYLARLLYDQFNVYYAVSNNVLENLVVKNGFKVVKTSGYKILYDMEKNYIVEEKKEKYSFLKHIKVILP